MVRHSAPHHPQTKETGINARRFFAVKVGVQVLSAGLVLMADSAFANDKDDKDRDSATGPSSVTQNWDKVLPAA